MFRPRFSEKLLQLPLRHKLHDHVDWRWWEIEDGDGDDGDDEDGDGNDDDGAAMTVVRMVIVQLGWFN